MRELLEQARDEAMRELDQAIRREIDEMRRRHGHDPEILLLITATLVTMIMELAEVKPTLTGAAIYALAHGWKR